MEPTPKVLLLALTFRVVEAADGNNAIPRQTSIRGKDHIRRSGYRFYQVYIC
jgi:hypothetical protein